MQKVGVNDLQDSGGEETAPPREHGVSRALGAGEIAPMQLAGAFGTLANGGRFIAPDAISLIEDRDGNVL